jgi:rhamnogalacturonyl hydrolase YesR
MKYLMTLLIPLLMYQCQPPSTSQKNESKEVKPTNTEEVDKVATKFINDLAKTPYVDDAIPRSLTADGALETTTSSKWTSGFYPGTLWYLYGHTKDDRLLSAATQWLTTLEKEKLDSTTHDVGFKVFCSYGTAWRLTGREDYKDVVVAAANSLSSRYSPVVKAIRSWDHHVIIDNMMNLELLFEAASASDNQHLYDVAVNHANTTLANHFREDHSTYHVLGYDPNTGAVTAKNTHQGHSHESAWSRGQAWGLYGYTMAYRYTKDQKYLDKANAIAAYIINHPNQPADAIPYWDYDAPNIPDELRDVSAASVTASALYELQGFNEEQAAEYVRFADKIINSLSQEAYQTDAVPFYLDHSVGSIPGNFEIDVPISYADYYYVEALLRQQQL